jgi:hypothetical protein
VRRDALGERRLDLRGEQAGGGEGGNREISGTHDPHDTSGD